MLPAVRRAGEGRVSLRDGFRVRRPPLVDAIDFPGDLVQTQAA